MAFHDGATFSVRCAIDNERYAIIKEHGLFNSPHEAVGVLQEEVNELNRDIKTLNNQMESYWADIERDQKEPQIEDLGKIYTTAFYAMLEAMQVAAVAQKEIITWEKRDAKSEDKE